MPSESFVHLRVHSAYSLSEGAIKPEQIAALAKADAMPAVAIADTANLFGALEFSQCCAKAGVQPIVGCQISLTRADNRALPPDPVVLLAQDEQGLANLRTLSSLGFLHSDPAARTSRSRRCSTMRRASSCSPAAPAARSRACSPKAAGPRPRRCSPNSPRPSPGAA